MNKKSILWILLDLIFIIVFNVVFFLAGGFEYPASTWLSYGFIHFAYLMVILTPFLIKKSSSSSVFGFSLYSISSTYFLIEFVVGLIFVFLKQEEINVPLIVQIVIAGIYLVILLAHLLANEHTADNVKNRENEVNYIKTTSSKVKALLGISSDKKINKEIEKVYDLLHSSPTKKSNSAHTVEKQIDEKIVQLQTIIKTDNTLEISKIIKELSSSIEERNRIIRSEQ